MTIEQSYDNEAETRLIGCLLLGGRRVNVDTGSEEFFIPAHQVIWATARDLLARDKDSQHVDYLLLKRTLDKGRILEDCGGEMYLRDLYHAVPNWLEYQTYARAVHDKYRIRQTIGTLNELQGDILGCETWEDTRAMLEARMYPLIADRVLPDRPFREIVADWHEGLSLRKEMLDRHGIVFGLSNLDAILGQQQPGELVIIGAGTNVGKSLLTAQGAIHNCMMDRPVGWISLEMTEWQYLDRMASHVGQVPMNRFRTANFEDVHIEKVNAATVTLMELPFRFTRARIDLERIITVGKEWAHRYGMKLLVVDYLQRVRSRRRFGNRQEEVSYISNELKELALDLGIVIWCPVQLNKEFEVRESAAITFDADIVIRILLNVNSYVNGTIVFDKYRQGKKEKPMKIAVKGWFMTVIEREWIEGEAEDKKES